MPTSLDIELIIGVTVSLITGVLLLGIPSLRRLICRWCFWRLSTIARELKTSRRHKVFQQIGTLTIEQHREHWEIWTEWKSIWAPVLQRHPEWEYPHRTPNGDLGWKNPNSWVIEELEGNWNITTLEGEWGTNWWAKWYGKPIKYWNLFFRAENPSKHEVTLLRIRNGTNFLIKE